jgi:signal transduction histidine kinase
MFSSIVAKFYGEAHGGTIWAQNNSDENGAIFPFTFPLEMKAHAT